MGEEILAGHISESGHPVAGVGGIGSVVGQEVAVEEVVDAPNKGIIDKRIGNLGGAEYADCTGVLAVIGATQPLLREAVAV